MLTKKLLSAHYQPIYWLLKEKYHYPPSVICSFLTRPRPQDFSSKIKTDLHRLFSQEPINYIIGFVNFLNCHVDLSLKPFIPRPETEFWVSQVIKAHQANSNLRILDLCSGSGCIGLALLKHLPGCQVDFADIDPQALKQTKINLALNQINPKRYRLFLSDLFSSLPENSYHLILTNPPYLDHAQPYLPELNFEPSRALFASTNGLSLINKIFTYFKPYSKPSTCLYLEFDPHQKTQIATLTKKLKLTRLQFHQDQFGIDRYLSLTPDASDFNINIINS